MPEEPIFNNIEDQFRQLREEEEKVREEEESESAIRENKDMEKVEKEDNKKKQEAEMQQGKHDTMIEELEDTYGEQILNEQKSELSDGLIITDEYEKAFFAEALDEFLKDVAEDSLQEFENVQPVYEVAEEIEVENQPDQLLEVGELER